jgi:glycosyltransferase involved in cell wall biosynthesis
VRVLMLSKACIVGIYQRKLEYIAAEGVELLVAVPPFWKDERGETHLERAFTDGYTLHATPIHLNGNFHLHHYPALPGLIRAFQPHIVHIDEEPYNLATWHALAHAQRCGAKTLFFTWQNIHRQYPPPFVWGERWTMRQADYALAGTDSAANVYREKGYTGPIAVIPQFGVDAAIFQPTAARPERPFTVGYVGRLVPEKGLDSLLRALGGLNGAWQARFVGGGPHRPPMHALADELGIAERLTFISQIPSVQMPAQYHEMDVLVLPSLTRPNWKEQFGRVLIEAMASGVPVIGSDSGAIPGVVGDAGLIVPEGDTAALTDALQQVRDDNDLCWQLREAGRHRALDHYTHQQVAAQTVAVYRQMIAGYS